MGNKIKYMGLVVLTTGLASSLGWSQVNIKQPTVTQLGVSVPAMLAAPAVPMTPTPAVPMTPTPAVPMMPTPAVPMSGVPTVANQSAAILPQTTNIVGGASVAGPEPDAQRNTLRVISEKKAKLELLKIQAEIDKLEKPREDAAKKAEANNIQSALEQVKKEQERSVKPAKTTVTVVEPALSVVVLATFGMPDVPGASYAEMKVGDLLVHAKVGDRLPSGHYVRAIHFDSVDVSKAKTGSKWDIIYISPAETANVYGGRARSGQSLGAAASAPVSLPPFQRNR